MINNKLEIFQRNNKEIYVGVVGLSDITPYTAYLTVKDDEDDNAIIIQKTGIVNDPSGTFTFSLTVDDTSIAAKDYVYDVTIIGNGNKLTIAKDIFSIIETVYD